MHTAHFYVGEKVSEGMQNKIRKRTAKRENREEWGRWLLRGFLFTADIVYIFSMKFLKEIIFLTKL